MSKYSEADQFVIVGMKKMIEEDGLTPQEAGERVEQLHNDIFFALCDVEKKAEKKKLVQKTIKMGMKQNDELLKKLSKE